MTRTRSLLLLLLLIAAALWFLRPSNDTSINKTIRLPDGSQWTLKGVTYGQKHRYPPDDFWQRILRAVPTILKWRLQGQRGAMDLGSTSVVVWVEFRGTPQRTVAFLEDESGFGSPTLNASLCSTPSPTESFEGWSFGAFPRRSRAFTLRLYFQDQSGQAGGVAGTFLIENPAYAKYPIWTPEPLPVTRRDSGCEFTLIDLETGVDLREMAQARAATNVADRAVRAVFRVAETGSTTNGWYPVGIQTMDATGNHVWSGEPTYLFSNGLHVFHYQPALWPSESAWNLRVEFSARSGFSADQLWSIKGLSLTETNLVINSACRTNLQGTSLQLLALMPTGPGDSVRTLVLRPSPYREDYRLTLLKAVDDRGRTAAERVDWLDSGFKFELKPEPDAKSIDVTFAFHQSRYEEFVAKPTLVSSTNSSAFPSPGDSATKAAR